MRSQRTYAQSGFEKRRNARRRGVTEIRNSSPTLGESAKKVWRARRARTRKSISATPSQRERDLLLQDNYVAHAPRARCCRKFPTYVFAGLRKMTSWRWPSRGEHRNENSNGTLHESSISDLNWKKGTPTNSERISVFTRFIARDAFRKIRTATAPAGDSKRGGGNNNYIYM